MPEAVYKMLDYMFEKLGVAPPDESRFGINVASLKLLVTKELDELLMSPQTMYTDGEVAELALAQGPATLIATITGEWFSFDLSPPMGDGLWQRTSLFIAEQLVREIRGYHRYLRYHIWLQERANERDEFWDNHSEDIEVFEPEIPEVDPVHPPLLTITKEVELDPLPEELGFAPWPGSDRRSIVSYAKADRKSVSRGKRPAHKPKSRK